MKNKTVLYQICEEILWLYDRNEQLEAENSSLKKQVDQYHKTTVETIHRHEEGMGILIKHLLNGDLKIKHENTTQD